MSAWQFFLFCCSHQSFLCLDFDDQQIQQGAEAMHPRQLQMRRQVQPAKFTTARVTVSRVAFMVHTACSLSIMNLCSSAHVKFQTVSVIW